SLPGCVGKAFTPMRPMKGPLGKTTLKTIFHAKPCQALFLRVTLNSYLFFSHLLLIFSRCLENLVLDDFINNDF
ncbi:MAG: hypothetical protein Q8Q40_06310, partial [Methylococcaceae bacterium]|nr:hypothetical protein [Methylococcaceae bacterium]MDP3903570.1 hypothetical protein [Methylococcaceae bacterium]